MMTLDRLLVLILFAAAAVMLILQSWYMLHGARLQMPIVGMAFLLLLGGWLLSRGVRRSP